MFALKIGTPKVTTVPRATYVKLAALLANEPVIGLDIETAYRDTAPVKIKKGHEPVIDYATLSPKTGRIALVQIYLPSSNYAIALHGEDISTTNPCMVALLQYVQDTSRVTVIHNALYESEWFLSVFKVPILNAFCTQIGHQLETAGLGFLINAAYKTGANTLATLCKRLLGIEIDKTEQASNWAGTLTESQIKYALLDPFLAYRCYIKLMHVMSTDAGRAEMSSIPVFSYINTHGIPADIMTLQSLATGYGNVAAELDETINNIISQYLDTSTVSPAGDGSLVPLKSLLIPKSLSKAKRLDWKFNIRSHVQLKTLINFIRGRQGKPPITTTKASQLEVLGDPLSMAIVEYRGFVKLGQYASKFIENYDPDTGRVKCSYSVLAVQSVGRSSARNGSLQIVANTSDRLYKRGLTGLKAGFTAAYSPADDSCERVMIKADFTASHLSLAMALSNDRTMLNAQALGTKIHHVTLSKILELSGKPMTIQEIISTLKDKSHPLNAWLSGLYVVSKNTIYSYINFAGGRTLQGIFAKKGVIVSVDECRLFLSACREAYSGVYAFMKSKAVEAERSMHKVFDTIKADADIIPLASLYGFTVMETKHRFIGMATKTVTGDGRVIRLPAIRKTQEDMYWGFNGEEWQSRPSQIVSSQWLSLEATILKSAAREIYDTFMAHPEWSAEIVGVAHDELPVICKKAHFKDVAAVIEGAFDKHFKRYAPTYVGETVDMLLNWEKPYPVDK